MRREDEMVSGRRTWLGLAICAALAFPGAASGTADASGPTATTAVAVPVSPCESYDYSPPFVNDISVSPASVDVTDDPAVITVHADAQDSGAPGVATGIKHLEVNVGSGAPGHSVKAVLHKSPEGDWSGTATLYPGVKGGTWRVSFAR